VKTTWLKCSKCAGKIRKKTYQTDTKGPILCVQCNIKDVKKRKRGYVENKTYTGYNRK